MLALAGCRGEPNPEDALGIAAAQQRAAAQNQPAAAAAATAAQTTPDHLVSFDIVVNGTSVGSFRKTGADVWQGPSLDSGEIVTWSQEDADALSLVLYTETPRIRTLSVYSDDTVSSSGLPSGATISRAAYQ